MKAVLSNYRQSPRKVRLVADVVRGKTAAAALAALGLLNKRAAAPLEKLLQSALANTRATLPAGEVLDPAQLVVSEVRVDSGRTLKRFRARARGSAAQILKRSSRVSLKLKAKS